VTGWKWAGVSLGRVALSFCCAAACDGDDIIKSMPQVAEAKKFAMALMCVALRIIQLSPRPSGDTVLW
jgi:hypothetical protein